MLLSTSNTLFCVVWFLHSICLNTGLNFPMFLQYLHCFIYFTSIIINNGYRISVYHILLVKHNVFKGCYSGIWYNKLTILRKFGKKKEMYKYGRT